MAVLIWIISLGKKDSHDELFHASKRSMVKFSFRPHLKKCHQM